MDRLTAGAGIDIFYGGADRDVVYYTHTDVSIQVDLQAGTGNGGYAEGDRYFDVDSIVGSQADDHLKGSLDNDTLHGWEGDDVVEGGAGDDTLFDSLGIDILNGGDGNDTVWSGDALITLVADLAAGTTGNGDTLISIENLHGSNVADTLLGDAGINMLTGDAGNDLLNGRGGADTLDGGTGIDTASYEDATGAIIVDLALGTASDGDTLISIENLIGGSAGDTLTGSTAANQIEGRDGDDVIDGGSGNDTLLGGAGDDVLIGNANRDIMTGGDGADRFVFQSLSDSGIGGATRDRIMDLDIAAGDRIDFSTLDIDPSTTAREALTYIGTGAYSGTAGEVRIADSANAGYTAVAIDSDGDGISNFIIEVALPLADFTADAFLL
ncbi:calcium-binding protein [Tistrella bauzanensis]|uniref:calcium-binding protein n=1 Tax=Tistrella bauzanensis TaxID=657419 RepID=UPI0038D4CAEB